MLLTHMWDSM